MLHLMPATHGGVNAPSWLVLTWRLPSASSTARVATWRSLQRLGAVTLTPGAAIVPFSEHLLEQLEWLAEDVVQRGGDAYVLPVTELPEADEEDIRRRVRQERLEEYERIRVAAGRARDRREVAALRRGLARAVERDHFASAGRTAAERALRRAEKE
jgi:ChrB-like protein